MSKSTIAPYVVASQGEVAKRSDAIRRAETTDEAVPATMPAPVRRNVLSRTSRRTRPALAPSAMRTPIS